MEKSDVLSSFLKRAAVSLVLIPLVVGCIMGGYPWIIFLAWTAAALLAGEWTQMVSSGKREIFSVIYFATTTLVMLLDSWWLAAGVITAGLGIAFITSKGEKERKLIVFGVPYMAVGLGSVLALYDVFGPLFVLWFLFVVWAVDIGGYLFGCTIKGPKLAPKISPKKTWAGFFGGMILAVAVSSGYFAAFSLSEVIGRYALASAGIAVAAQVGDLVESAVKRHLHLKDSSNLIPGHGGIFDRVDGLIFAAPIAYIILTCFALFLR